MSFDERGKTEETKYKHDLEVAFKVRIRRNKLFGRWLAENHLGKTGEEAEAYAKTVVMADFDGPGHEDVLEKVRADLEASGAQLSDHLLEKHFEQCEAEAKEQVSKE